MSDRKWHPVVGSSTFKPGFGRFARGEAVVLIAAFGFGLVLFRFLNGPLGWPTWLSGVAAAAAPTSVAVVLGYCVVGKPRDYLQHFLTWQWMRLAGWLAAHGVPVAPKPLIEIEQDERN